MLNHKNVVSLHEQSKIKLSPSARQWVNACKKTFATQLFEQLQDVLGRVDDTLFSLADRADNNQDQTRYFEAMREIRKHRKQIESRFVKEWSSAFETFWRSGESPFNKKKKQLEDAEFSLIEEDDLEENLAVEAMISKGNIRYKQPLDHLCQRVSHVLHGMPVDVLDNPFAPSMICHAYHNATKSLPIDIKVKLVLGKLFERHFIAELEAPFEALNEQWADLGVLPDLKSKKVKHVVKKSAHSESVSAAQHAVDQTIQVELFNSLQELLTMRRAESGQPTNYDGPQFESSQVVNALSTIQNDDTGMYHADSMLDLRAILLGEVKKLQNDSTDRNLGQSDSDTLDVLTMIFDFILEDHNLPDSMKAIIGRLQIPMLKVSILDKSFFSRKDHPARRLLNEMAQAGLGWNPDEGLGENTLYGVMNKIVQRVLNEFDSQISLFDELLEDFRAFVEKEGKYAQAAEKRTNQITQGKEQLELAKLQSGIELDKRLSEYFVPDNIRSLLEEGWKDVLMLLYLRQGVDSEQYKNGLQLLDDLLWSLQPLEGQEERQKLLKLIPSIMQKLQLGLTDISFESHKLNTLLKAIKDHHIGVLRGTIEIPVLQPEQVVREGGQEEGDSGVEEIVMEGAVETAEEKSDDDEFTVKAKAMKIGTWLEFVDENSTVIRCKLSWKSDVTETYVFVNRRGVKVADMSLNGLAAMLRRETTLIIENVPLMDRAMSAMMSALKG